ncbi:hypothetical protein JCM8547_001332 [Rhodosporidiobolus lusitaniae]
MSALHHTASPAVPTLKRALSSETVAGGPPATQKKRITRRRVVLACRACTSRKIRCEREQPGQTCKACEKRGDACDAGSQPSSSGSPASVLPLPLHGDACADHRSDLERRVSILEQALLNRRLSRGEVSTNGDALQQDGPDSETEDAAMTLEDIAVNFRIARPATTRRGGPEFTPTTTFVPPLPPPAGQSREMESLIVPEISRRYRGVMEDLFETLPDRPKMDFLINHYFSVVSWWWVVHHEPTFRREYDAFTYLVQCGRQFEVDPIWLGVLFLTLAHSVGSLDFIPVGAPFAPEDLDGVRCSLFEAARAALDAGDFAASPKLRTLQAVLLLAVIALNSGNPAQVDVLVPYVAAAIRLAQQMKLDTLGSDPTVMPPEDLALPNGSSTFRREMALKWFHGVLHVDQILFSVRPMLPMKFVNSAFPGNYHDSDFERDGFLPPRPPQDRTLALYDLVRLRTGVIQRHFQDNVILDPSYNYSTVLVDDAAMCDLITEFDLERPDLNETTIQLWARLFALQNIQIRRCRFNRPFMSRGYRDPAFRKSTDNALAAARTVLETQKELDRTNAPLLKDCYHLNHLQIAVIIVFMDIWQNYDPESDSPSADYRLVSDASAVFHRMLGALRSRVRMVARQSLLVIQCLFEALHARTASGRKEPFAQLLKRVSVAISETERRAALAGPVPPPAPGVDGVLAPPFFADLSATLPAPEPSTGDGRALLLDISTPSYDTTVQTPFFPPADSSQQGSSASFSPNDLHFGSLADEWGFSWLGQPLSFPSFTI